MQQHDLALELLSVANDDLDAATLLSVLPEAPDTIIWFHSQQVAEKALKAVLAEADVDFPRTHKRCNITWKRFRGMYAGSRGPATPRSRECVYGLACIYPFGR